MSDLHFLSAHPMGQSVEAQKIQADVVELLIKAYYSELSTAMNYIAIVNNVEGFQGDTIRRLLENDIQEEIGHAITLAQRIRTLGFTVPSSGNFKAEEDSNAQSSLSVAAILTTNALSAIMKAEQEAMNLYKQIIDLTRDYDPVTADIVTTILAEEEEHFRSVNKLLGN
jgi:bacterioferritin